MYYAKTMYQGGTIVCADDANYSSYLDDGLLCLVCGEEVHLRSGYERRPHFAHHKAVALGSEKCPLRVTGYSDGWSGLTPEGRGQRRELFQKHFLNMIASIDSEFSKKIEITKDRIFSKLLKYITEQCIDFFYNYRANFILECLSLAETSYDNKLELVLQRLIASEAIDYLCVASSRSFLALPI